MGLDLDQDIDRLVIAPIHAGSRIREPAPAGAALDHRGVVAIGRKHAERGVLVGVANHLEQRTLALTAIDHELRIEDLVAAVLGVHLREHHQLDIAGIALEGAEGLQQVVDVIVGQRQTQTAVGIDQSGAALP
jgi:hypothetical protein